VYYGGIEQMPKEVNSMPIKQFFEIGKDIRRFYNVR
jgi:hypothetical protein